jgi:hypothetical protein
MDSKKIQLIEITPQQLETAILDGVKIQIENLKENFLPERPTEYLTRQEVAKMLKVDLSTLHNWHKKGKLVPYGLGGRVYYKRSDLDIAIIKL